MSDNNQDILGQINATTAQPAATGAPTAQNVATFGADMLASAKAGHFAVEPEYAQQLIKGLNDELDKLRELSVPIEQLRYGIKLGETPAAVKVAPFYLEQVATTGPHAFIRNHELGMQALQNMVQAIQVAMGNYRATDDGTADHFKPAN